MSRFADILSRTILSAQLTLIVATVLGPLTFLISSLTNPGSEDFAYTLLLWALVSVVLAMPFLATLLLGLFLPLRLVCKAQVLPLGVIGLTALAGGVIGSLPWLLRKYQDEVFGLTPLSPVPGANNEGLIMAAWIGSGVCLGGAFAAIYAFIERRDVRQYGIQSRSLRLGLLVNTSVALVLPTFVLYMFTTPWRMITFARMAAVRNQVAILEEAQKLLDQAALTEDGSLSIGFDKPMPPNLAKLGQTASVTLRQPDAVKVHVTGGFTHYGLYIIPKDTTATKEWLQNDARKLKRVNQFIYQFDDEA